MQISPINTVCHGSRSTTTPHRLEYFLSNKIQWQSRGREKNLIWKEKWFGEEEKEERKSGDMMKKVCCQWDGRRPIIRENKSVQGCHWRREEQQEARRHESRFYSVNTFTSYMSKLFLYEIWFSYYRSGIRCHTRFHINNIRFILEAGKKVKSVSSKKVQNYVQKLTEFPKCVIFFMEYIILLQDIVYFYELKM